MSDTCKCGHSKTLHGPFECDKCSCTDHEPAKQEASQWLDAPTGDGWYWKSYRGVVKIASVKGAEYEVAGDPDEYEVANASAKWQRIEMPTPPPAPLPSSRSVTLTAKVWRNKDYEQFPWTAEVHVMRDGYPKTCDRQQFATSRVAVEWIGNTWGIQAEVSDE